MAEQAQLPLDAEIDPYAVERHWAHLAEIHAAEWIEEMYCLAWVVKESKVDPRNWKDWWDGLPKYERDSIFRMYQGERERVDMGLEMRSFDYLKAVEEEAYQHSLAIVTKWAQDIRQAAVRGEPCPIRPLPQYQYMLDWAFDIAGVVIVQAAPPMEDEEEEKPRRRRRTADV